MQIINPCEHVKSLMHYKLIKIHTDNEACMMNFQRFDNGEILDSNVVKFCPMCGTKIELS